MRKDSNQCLSKQQAMKNWG